MNAKAKGYLLALPVLGLMIRARGRSFRLLLALSYAVYIVGINRTRLKDVATVQVTFYVLLFGLSLFVVRLCSGAGLQVPDCWYLWGNLIALGVIPTAISLLCTTAAIQYIGSSPRDLAGSSVGHALVRLRKMFPKLKRKLK